MIDQNEEERQMEIENDIRLTLDNLYNMLQKWDAEGNEELAEEMTGSIAEWKARLDGDDGAFDEDGDE